MTNEQIVQAAREAGYEAEIRAGAVLVSLKNQSVSVAQVASELDLPGGAVTPTMTPFLGGVWVLGSDGWEASKPAYGLDWAEHMALQGDEDDPPAEQLPSRITLDITWPKRWGRTGGQQDVDATMDDMAGRE